MKSKISCNLLLVLGVICLGLSSHAQTINRPAFIVNELNNAGTTFCRNEPFFVQFQSQTFADSNVFLVELSDSAGLFTNPVTIGELFANQGNNTRILCRMPDTAQPGSAYRFRIKSSAPESISPLNQNSLIISSGRVQSNNHESIGNNIWKGHVYTWHSSVNVTEPIANTINFFDSTKYQASFEVNSLSFSLDMRAGVLSETISGVSNLNGCTKANYFSIRLKRRQYFDSGYYAFRMRGDDGIRFSTDGGATWLLSSWTRQSNVIVCHNNCCGVYMTAGVKDLVFEFFEEAGEATLELTMEKSGAPGDITPPQNLSDSSICASTLPFPIGFIPAGGRYSGLGIDSNGVFYPDSGQAGNRVINYETGIYGCRKTSSVNFNINPRPETPILIAQGSVSICEGLSVPISSNSRAGLQWYYNGDSLSTQLDSVVLASQSGLYTVTRTDSFNCTSRFSNPIELIVSRYPEISNQPRNANIQNGQNATFEVEVDGANLFYQWQIDSLNSGFMNLDSGGRYQGVKSTMLTVENVGIEDQGHRFRCLINRNQCYDTTEIASLSILTSNKNKMISTRPVLYPNPGTDVIHIKSMNKENYTICIFDFTGKQVLQVDNSEFVSVKGLGNGVYFWKYKSGKESYFGSWVKQ